MQILILWADEKSENIGVQALAAGTAALVGKALGDVDITWATYQSTGLPMAIGDWRALAKERVTKRHGLMDWLSQFDLVVDTRAGDSFTDIYGLERLTTMSFMAELAAQAHTPVVMGPQTLGPFTTRRGKLEAKRSLARARAILARDSASAAFAHGLGFKAESTTDCVFALPAVDKDTVRDVVLNVSGLLWNENPHVDYVAYRHDIVRLSRELLADGRHLTLLAHVLDSPQPDNDVPAIRDVAAALDNDQVELAIPTGLQDVRTILAGAQVTIGARMHACLNSISVGTPAVPMAYSRKFAPLLADLGWLHTVDMREPGDRVARIHAEMAAITTADLDRALDVAAERLTAAEFALRAVV